MKEKVELYPVQTVRDPATGELATSPSEFKEEDAVKGELSSAPTIIQEEPK